MQIAESMRPAFAEGPVSREELLKAAEETGAAGVRSAIAGLPEGKRFNALRDLWTYLHDVPVEPGA